MTQFRYYINAMVTFTGRELWLMHKCCHSTYDSVANAMFNPGPPGKNLGGFGYGWVDRFKGQHQEGDSRWFPDEVHDKTVVVEVSPDKLELLIHGMRLAKHLKDAELEAQIDVIDAKIRIISREVNAEHERLNPRRSP